MPVATLVPHVYPHMAPGFPPYSIGARLPRTRLGARLWTRTNARFVEPALEQGRDELNESRRRLGLPPLPYVHTGLSRSLTLVATLPQLEYPREWPAWVRVVGPLMWEPPGEQVEPPPGDGPVVLVAPSTAQDREHRLLRAALAGLAREPVRVIATWNGREPDPPVAVPANAVLVPWLSYSQTMPPATWSSATAATGRSCARSPTAARSWSARRSATWPRTPRAWTGPGSACGCRAASRRRAGCARRSGARCGEPAAARARAGGRGLGGGQRRGRPRRRGAGSMGVEPARRHWASDVIELGCGTA